MSLELLLTDLRTLGPAMGQGLALSSAHHAPRPEQRAPCGLSAPGHSNDLGSEGWGVVIPDSDAGKERLQWIRPLTELRRRQCGAGDIEVLRAPPGQSARDARQWRAEYEAMHPLRRPGYLLLLGDLDEISLALQQELMVSACVGRLCFTTPEGTPDRAGYEAYCAKICDMEAAQQSWSDEARLLFYASRDGSDAVNTGYMDLIRRCYLDARQDQGLPIEDFRIFGSAADHQWYTGDEHAEARERTLLYWAEMRQPAVLLSMSHGAGLGDPVEQRLRQGAVVLGEAAGKRRTEVLDHGFFARRFLPSGFWFLKACFGAGTPTVSAYQRWIEVLSQRGLYQGNLRVLSAYLAPTRPFVARLPQVALAHPEGPLGVLGHVDLAWTFGYQGLDESDGHSVRAEHGPYYDVVRAIVKGSRFGLAVASLSEKVQTLGTHLATLYRDSDAAGKLDDATLALRAWLWMRTLDLGGYILLGDPAAQVPTRAARDVAMSSSTSPRRDAGGKEGARAKRPEQASSRDMLAASRAPAAAMERAVLAYLRQKQSPGDIAREAGVHVTTLERWVRTYRDAGRGALSAIASEQEDPEKAS